MVNQGTSRRNFLKISALVGFSIFAGAPLSLLLNRNTLILRRSEELNVMLDDAYYQECPGSYPTLFLDATFCESPLLPSMIHIRGSFWFYDDDLKVHDKKYIPPHVSKFQRQPEGTQLYIPNYGSMEIYSYPERRLEFQFDRCNGDQQTVKILPIITRKGDYNTGNSGLYIEFLKLYPSIFFDNGVSA